MSIELIERQYKDSEDIREYLMNQKEITFAEYVNGIYTKVLVVSIASYYEKRVIEALICYAQKSVGKDKRLVSLIEKKLANRQYHTFFAWDKKNTNMFWSLFGEEAKKRVRMEIDSNPMLKEAEENFISLGRERNRMVHENFVNFSSNYTKEEIYKMYKSANNFISFLEKFLDPCYGM